jgi:hypothetical protein
MSLINQAASNYQFYATNNPIITNSVTGFIIASCGDLLCQKVFDSWEKKSAREKRAERMSPGNNYISLPDGKEAEKVQSNAMKTIRGTFKNSDTHKGSSSDTKTVVQRNIFQKTLFRNKIKKAVQVPAVTRQLASTEEVEKPFKWDSVRTIHLGVIRACKKPYNYSIPFLFFFSILLLIMISTSPSPVITLLSLLSYFSISSLPMLYLQYLRCFFYSPSVLSLFFSCLIA